MSTGPTPALSYTEQVELLTGHDELAIEKHFGKDLDSLRFTLQLRALFMCHTKRSGATEKDAYKAAMDISLKALGDQFADEEPEIDDNEPITEQGKEPSADE